jgi:hypothetical protein
LALDSNSTFGTERSAKAALAILIRNNVIVHEGSAMKLRQSPVPEMPVDLKKIVAEEK